VLSPTVALFCAYPNKAAIMAKTTRTPMIHLPLESD
jgi:hypothetical protein